ncbi:MAG TPA: hypothetical protein VLJ37_11855 [bacterium]|nr:hypothetical protein [bacterium]
MTRKAPIVCLAVLTVFLAVFGAAPERAAADCLCEEEASRLCADVEPGQGRIWTCLLDHESMLGWECKRHINRRSGALRPGRKGHDAAAPAVPPAVSEDVQRLCKGDRKKYCKYVDWKDGRVGRCLRIHETQISSKCRAALEP